jgi:hypothetical protein
LLGLWRLRLGLRLLGLWGHLRLCVPLLRGLWLLRRRRRGNLLRVRHLRLRGSSEHRMLILRLIVRVIGQIVVV